jgi:hypothetical protein
MQRPHRSFMAAGPLSADENDENVPAAHVKQSGSSRRRRSGTSADGPAAQFIARQKLLHPTSRSSAVTQPEVTPEEFQRKMDQGPSLDSFEFHASESAVCIGCPSMCLWSCCVCAQECLWALLVLLQRHFTCAGCSGMHCRSARSISSALESCTLRRAYQQIASSAARLSAIQLSQRSAVGGPSSGR